MRNVLLVGLGITLLLVCSAVDAKPADPDPGAPTLENGQATSVPMGPSGTFVFRKVYVYEGATSLTVVQAGPNDSDMHVRFGARPTTGTYDCRPFNAGSAETCSFGNPAAGWWYIGLDNYQGSGYSVTITATHDGVNQEPTPDFTASPLAATPGTTITFDGSLSSDPDGTISAWEWDFDGDGTFDAYETTPLTTHEYDDSGLYSPVLRAYDDEDLPSDTTRIEYVDIWFGPSPYFEANKELPRLGQEVTFTSMSGAGSAPIASYAWTFEDAIPATATGIGPHVVEFNRIGLKTITLHAIDEHGMEQTYTATDYIDVKPVPGPNADFEADILSVEPGDVVRFSDLTAAGGGDVSEWHWSFENGAPATAMGAGPHDVTYHIPGTHAVSLTAIDEFTQEHSLSKSSYIAVADYIGPSADFSWLPAAPAIGQLATFTDDSLAGHGAVSAWAWDFGDDGSIDSTMQHPTHTFGSAGYTDVRLTVTDVYGQESEVVHELQILTTRNDPADATPDGYTTNEDTPLTAGVSVLANDIDPEGDWLEAYVYDMPKKGTLAFQPDGFFGYSPDPNVNGIDSFKYCARDTVGNIDCSTASINIISIHDNPVADFDIGSITLVGTAVTFTDTSQYIDAPVDTIEWQFEGESLTGANVQRMFTQGQHSVTLTVTDIFGGTDTTTKTLTVGAQPIIDIVYDEGLAYPTGGILFTTNFAGALTDIVWTAGGQTYTGPSMRHGFPANGDYQVTVTGVDEDGANAAGSTTVQVRAPTRATISGGGTGNAGGFASYHEAAAPAPEPTIDEPDNEAETEQTASQPNYPIYRAPPASVPAEESPIWLYVGISCLILAVGAVLLIRFK